MLPENLRRSIPASLLVTGALALGVIAASGAAGAALAPSTATLNTLSTVSLSPQASANLATATTTTATATTATTTAVATVAHPAVRTQVLRRSSAVLGVSVRLRATVTSPNRRVVVVRVSVTSVVKATATINKAGHVTTSARTSKATRYANHVITIRTTRAVAVTQAKAAAIRGARQLADNAARRAATASAITAVRASAASAVANPTPPTSPAPAPKSPPAASTVLSPNAMPVGNLPGWRQVFADDFTRSAPRGSFLSTYGSKWSAYPSPWKDTSGHGSFNPGKTLSASAGVLDMFLHTENGVHCVSAPTPKIAPMTYGRYSIRFQSDSLPGYKAAWLLWPDDNVWPAHGEIDFPEGDLNSNFSAFAHFASGGGGQDAFTLSSRFSSWHTATINWTPSKLVFILDGKVVGTSTKMVPSKPMHWVLQTETALTSAAPSNAVSGHVRIDWVTAYAYAP